MGLSKPQKAGIVTTCQCGCGQQFKAFPTYRSKTDGGGLRVPEYMRGHHPNCRKTQTCHKSAWNKGLSKADHPSIARMGFQPGHQPYNDWSNVNEMLRSNLNARLRWIEAKRGQVAWNSGKSKADYPKGIKAGSDHGNWKGGHGGYRDTQAWKELRTLIQRRDKWTCQHCGDHNHKLRGERIQLEVHHIVSVCEAPALASDPFNLITLCHDCHTKTHNYGSKGRKRSGS